MAGRSFYVPLLWFLIVQRARTPTFEAFDAQRSSAPNMAGISINGTEASERTSTVAVKDAFQHQHNKAPAHHSNSNGVSKGPSSQQTHAETAYQHPMSLDDVRESTIALFDVVKTAAAIDCRCVPAVQKASARNGGLCLRLL